MGLENVTAETLTKNSDFVLERGKNQGKSAHSDTKMPFLCSKSPKMRVSNPKSAQKPRFCARNARKRGFQTPKSTKTPILCSGRLTGGLGCSSRPTQRASGSGEVAAGHQNEASGRRKRAAGHQKEASGRANAHKFVYF